MNRDAIKTALDRIGQGLTAGDAVTASEAWGLPATIFSEAGATVATVPGQLADVVRRTIQGLRRREAVSTRPEIEAVEELNPRLALVKVRWPAFDRAGQERLSDRALYIMELGDDGRARIRVAAAFAS